MRRFPRFSALAILAAVCPAVVWADEPAGGGGGGAGGNTDPTPLSKADLDQAVQAALSARDAEYTAQFEKATGFKSFQAFEEAKAQEKGEHAKIIEQRTAENAQLKTELDNTRIENAILAHAGGAIKPEQVLALLRGQAKVDNGAVTIGGKSPADAVAAFLSENPHLAKPSGNSGGGTPTNGGDAEPNPWLAESYNLTKQIEIRKADPAKADRLKAAAEKANKAAKR